MFGGYLQRILGVPAACFRGTQACHWGTHSLYGGFSQRVSISPYSVSKGFQQRVSVDSRSVFWGHLNKVLGQSPERTHEI